MSIKLLAAARRWKIPRDVALIALARDTCCIYCQKAFDYADRRSKPSWEHIVNDATLAEPWNIALCCVGCNASKGARGLADWLETAYCAERLIIAESIAQVARAALSCTLRAKSG